MAWYPYATHRPLPENSTQGTIDPTQVILHTAVDAAGETDLYGFFARGDVVVESHFFIQLDGDVIQYMDTTRRADANRYSNDRAISIETEDDGNPDQRAWTAAQLQSIKLLGQWLMHVHPRIARRVCPAWDQPGWGYHSMWGAPSQWTPAEGKTCPGPPRITQFKTDITYWLNGSSGDDLDMDDNHFKGLVRAVLNEGTAKGQATWADTSAYTVALLQYHTNQMNTIVSGLKAIDTAVDTLAVEGAEVDYARIQTEVKNAIRDILLILGS